VAGASEDATLFCAREACGKYLPHGIVVSMRFALTRRAGITRTSARCLFALLVALVALHPAVPLEAKVPTERREVQGHGVWFEKWVRDTFFDG
jgi:hypothetical protein